MKKYYVKYWDEKIENIMNQFDFTRIHRTMDGLDWRWGGDTTPNVEEMRKTARRLLNDATKASVVDGKPHYCGTGGFYAETIPSEGYVSLKFVVEEYDTWDGI